MAMKRGHVMKFNASFQRAYFSNEDVPLTKFLKTFDHTSDSNEAEKDCASYGRSAPPVEQWRGQTSADWVRDAARTTGGCACLLYTSDAADE